MRRELETELRILLLGHERGNPGDGQGDSYGLPRQLSTLPAVRIVLPFHVTLCMEANIY